MSTPIASWSVRLSDDAERDLRDLILWTDATFGEAQTFVYATAVSAAIDSLQRGPKIAGVRARGDLEPGLFSLRVKIRRRGARHLVFFRVAEAVREIVVVRILHDAMDPSRHLRPETNGG